MRVVADVNVLVSGSLWPGPSSSVLEAARDGRIALLITDELLRAVADVVSRPKLRNQIERMATSGPAIVSSIRDIAQIVEPIHLEVSGLRDSDDAVVIACAVGGNADIIVSGDRDLLTLKVFRGIPVMTPADAQHTFGRKGAR